MDTDGGTAVASKTGGRPTAAAETGCGACGHPFALHSNGTTPCRAYACTAGTGGKPCAEFASKGTQAA